MLSTTISPGETLRSTMIPLSGARKVTFPQGFSVSLSFSLSLAAFSLPSVPCFTRLTHRPSGVFAHGSLSA